MVTSLFSLIGVTLSLLRYATYYIRAMIRGTTKPHALSWIGAGLMCGIAWMVQLQEQAGPTVWVTGVVTFFCMGIGIAAIFMGEKHITKSDWVSFILALAIIPVWLVVNQPAVSLILVLLTELLNYYPTVRKSYLKPSEEDVVSWSLSALRWFCATLAITHYSFNTVTYPAFISFCEIGIVVYLLVRRHQLAQVLSL